MWIVGGQSLIREVVARTTTPLLYFGVALVIRQIFYQGTLWIHFDLIFNKYHKNSYSDENNWQYEFNVKFSFYIYSFNVDFFH